MAYTTIDDPSEHFQTAIYTGNGSTQTITNDGNSDLQLDLAWIKRRDAADNHVIVDTSRGLNKWLYANSDEDEVGTETNGITSVSSDSFALGSSGSYNANTGKYATWQWKLNGGTTTTNNDGNRSVTLQANADAGISLGLYEGSGGDGATYGHGLGAVPDMVIMKNRDNDDYGWTVWHSSISPTHALSLHYAGAKFSIGGTAFQTFTSSVIALESWAQVNHASSFMFLAFTGIKGYSSFGRWTGNVSALGPFIYTGFKPAFILWKPTGASENWIINDARRKKDATDNNKENEVYERIYPNLNAYQSSSQAMMDILSNGFRIRTADTAWNGNGLEYVYAAFAEQPFVTSTGTPCTAR